mgnify:CR=1 FL=1
MTRPRDIADSINRINSSAADATAVTIDSSERVGIGTSSPAAELDVVGATTSGTAETVFRLSQPASSISAHNEIRSGVVSATDPYMAFAVRETSSPFATVERWRIVGSNGNLKAATDGVGIDFSASAGSGASSSVLDDYEEGTWTPGITGMTYTYAGGAYTKIGRRVQCSGFLIECSSGTASAVGAKISGLPFTVSNTLGTTSLEDGGLFTYFTNLGVSTSTITVTPDDSSTECFLYRVVAGGSTTVNTLLRTAVDDSLFSCRFFFTYIST